MGFKSTIIKFLFIFSSVGLSFYTCPENSRDIDDWFDSIGAACIDYDTDAFDSTRADFSNGKFSISVGTSEDALRSITAQTNGRLVAVGRSSASSVNRFLMVRLDVDGNLDPTLSTTGTLTLTIGTQDAIGHKVFVDSSERIIAAGRTAASSSNMDFLAVRFLSTGAFDTSFATVGYAIIAVGTHSDVARTLVAETNGNYQLAGYSWTTAGGGHYIASAVRILSSGQLDTAFNTTGRLTLDFLTTSVGLLAEQLDTLGRYVFGGTIQSTDWQILVGRFTSNGNLDTSFFTAGYAILSIGTSHDQLYDLQINNEKILIAGSYYNGTNMDAAFVRLNSNGDLDTAFNATGKIGRSFSTGDDFIYSLQIEPLTGAFVAGGYGSGTNQDFLAARFTSNGALDTFFATVGFQFSSVSGTNDQGGSVFLTSSGQLYQGGRVINGASDSDLGFSRYSAAGTLAPGASLDDSFGSSGFSNVSFISGQVDQGHGLDFQPDGRIVVSGVTPTFGMDQYEAIRILPNGSLDTSFATTGKASIGPSNPGTVLTGRITAISTEGKIAVFGYVSTGQVHVLRLTTNGRLDTSFATIGYVLVSGGSTNHYGIYASDGRLYSADINGTVSRISRFMSNGTLDTSYNVTGVAIWTGPSAEGVRGIWKDANDRILMSGNNQGSPAISSVGRLKTNGTLDTSFYTVGWRHFTVSSAISSMAGVQTDSQNRIIVAAIAVLGGAGDDFVRTYRLLSDGSLDTSFSTTGFSDVSMQGDIAAYIGQIILFGTDKIIVDTQKSSYLHLIRLNSNGKLDTSFATAGHLQISYSTFNSFRPRLSKDGRICGTNLAASDYRVFCLWP